MDQSDARGSAQLLHRLETLIVRMDALGVEAEDAAARLTAGIPQLARSANADLVTAIGDVIETVTERSKLAHEAHRVISELRRLRHEPGSAASLERPGR